MKRGVVIYFLLASLFTTSIAIAQSNEKISRDRLARHILGEWRNQLLRVTINSYNNKDTTVFVEATSSNWEEKLHIKLIRTYFQRGGTYYSEYRNLNDSVIRRPSGEWFIKGDSIIMTEMTPERVVFRLHLTINKNIATFKGLIDFDGDGKLDDEYYGQQRKFK